MSEVGAQPAAEEQCEAGYDPEADGVRPRQKLVGSFSGSQFIELRKAEGMFQGSSPSLESGTVTITAWVSVDAPDSGQPGSIQTIAASKASGCEANTAHNGISLFVNAWNTNSGQLFVSWGNRDSGCEELASEGRVIRDGQWAFVSATVTADGDAILAVNTKVVAHTRHKTGVSRISATNGAVEREMGGAMRIGQHADGTHPLRGFLAEVGVWPGVLSAAQLRLLMCGKRHAVPLQPTVIVPFAGKGRSLLPQSFDASEIVASDVKAGSSEGLASPPLVTLAAAASQQHGTPRSIEAFNYKRDRPSNDEANTIAAGGWPLTWLPPRNVYAMRGSAESNATELSAPGRRDQVRGVMKRAWNAYKQYAFGADEIKPVSNRSHNWLHLGATLVDCLDNLWIMGLRDEFAEAREWVAKHLHFDRSTGISMFETVIRILGGLLSAFDLSGDRLFLDKSRELADKMHYAFKRNPTGLPCTTISLTSSHTCSHPSWAQSSAILAEFGTIQLEYKYLAYHTGDRKYWDVAETIMQLMRKVDRPHGLFPTFMNPGTGRWNTGKIAFGALGDSFYEYLVKQWLQTRKVDGYLREMWEGTMLAMAKLLVQKTTPSELVYVADWSGSSLMHKMDHLACFIPAMLAIGSQDGGKYDAEFMTLADRLGETCYEMYARTASGLSPEYVQFVPGRDMRVAPSAKYNIGRPEAVESFFVMWYYTRDPKWREMGWKVFEAFERHASTGSGWTALPDVDTPSRKRDDKMESFVLAETVKYLYLLFDSSYPVDLSKMVFNTEAHPLSMFDKPSWAESLPDGGA